MTDDEDQDRLDWVRRAGNELTDANISEATLIDDICQNEDRELKPHERGMIDRMRLRFNQTRRK